MKNALFNTETVPAPTLTESVRIPLHSLQADLEYLIGRVIADGSCGPMIVRSMRERLNQIETAVQSGRDAERETIAPHVTRPIKVWIDADVGIADFILELNEIAGIRTLASCQGTIGEGGEHPYGPHVMVAWEDDQALARISHLKMTRLGPAFGYVYPPETRALPSIPPRRDAENA